MSLVAAGAGRSTSGKHPANVNYLANFANCVPGITYHRIDKMRTLGSLWKN